MSNPAFKSIEIPSVMSEAVRVQRIVLHEVVQQGFDDQAQFAIRLALDEALANAIHHGNADDPAKRVVIHYHVDEKKCEIRVQDEGAGFDPQRVPDPTQPENLSRPNGRGVMLMRAYMNDVEFSQAGNEVTLVKRRSSGQG